MRVDDQGTVTQVKVVTGYDLEKLDTTGALTQKYQARLVPGAEDAELITNEDTHLIRPLIHVADNLDLGTVQTPLEDPRPSQLLPISAVFDRLRSLVGTQFPDAGSNQERKRGDSLHTLVCQTLGYTRFEGDGRFPDLKHQILEVKLQTSQTIDLGLVRPDSEDLLDTLTIGGRRIRHCDVRYALFCAKTDGENVSIQKVFVTTGEKFFTRFPQFQGNVTNRKLQIPLPSNFFEDE